MIYMAVKRSIQETTYRQHAFIDDDSRGALVNGRYAGRPYQIGDRIVLDRGTVAVSEIFDGFTFHANKPVRCFNVEEVTA
jgi:hypothetical protein